MMASRISWRELVAAQSTIPAAGGRIATGRLVTDAARDCVIYLPGWAEGEVGLSFRLEPGGWVADSTRPFTLPREPVQAPLAFWDEGRGGIAYWTLFGEGGQGHPLGLLIRPDGVTPIAQSGEGPRGPGYVALEAGLLFGYDVGRQVTVVLAPDAVWELSPSGVWSRVADVPPGTVPATALPSGRGALYDTAGRRLLFILIDFSSVMPVVLAWDGAQLRPISTEGMPRRMLWNCPTYFVRPGGAPTFIRSGEGTCYELRGDAWVEVGAPGGRTPGFRAVPAAAARSGPLVLGPGQYDKPGGAADEQVFYLLEGGQCARQGAAQRGPGESARSGPRLLAASDAGVFALRGDGELHALRPAPAVLAPARAELADAAALAADDRGGVACVTRTGALWRFAGGSWQELAPPEPALQDRIDLRLVFEPSAQRWIAWGGRTGTTLHGDTWAARGGGWACVSTLDPFVYELSRKRYGRDKRSARHHLVYDPTLRQVLLFSDGEVAALQDSGWVPVPCLELRTTMRTGEYAVMPAGGEILVLGFQESCLTRFDAADCRYLETIDRTDGGTHLSSSVEGHPAGADLVFDPAARELLLLGDAELRPTHVLPLGDAFARAQSLPPRAGFAQRLGVTLPDALDQAVAQVVARAAADMTPEAVQRMTGLSLGNCPDFLVRELGIKWWRKHGEGALAEARAAVVAEAEADPEAFEPDERDDPRFQATDCQEPFLRAFAHRLCPPFP